MRTTRTVLFMSAMATVASLAALPVLANDTNASHDLFVMTNNADANEVIAYEGNDYGTLLSTHAYKTGGRGSGGQVDPLASQGSLTLSDDRSLLFATNAGSGELSVFAVQGAHLSLLDKAPTGGSEPNAVAQHGNLVYVLNTAGSSSVVGFALRNGQLTRIPDSLRFLSGTAIGSGSLAFSPNGKYLLVTEKATNNIDVFSVLPNGTLSPVKVNAAVTPGTFSVAFAPNGTALVASTGTGGTTSTISSYAVQSDGTVAPISSGIPTLGAATCWVVATPNGRFAYTSNAGTATISGFAIGSTGVLTALPGTTVGANPAGSTNIDIAVSSDGKFLFTLNTGTGAVAGFAIQPNGTLTNLGTLGGLPAAAGLNGIAAN